MGKKTITYKRYLNKDYLMEDGSEFLNTLINNRNNFFSFSARMGLLRIIDSFQFNKDTVVLLPAFIPQGLILPFKKKGIKIIFYNSSPKLEPKLEDLKKKVNKYNVKMIIVIHYFGIKQNLKEIKTLTTKKNIILIEDCAQALFTKDNNEDLVGYEGDIAFYSFTKFLPVTDGSLFVFNNDKLFDEESFIIEKKSIITYVAWLFNLISLKVGYLELIFENIFFSFMRKAFYLLYYKLICYLNNDYKISNYSFKILSQYNYSSALKIRLRNIKYLYNNITSDKNNFMLTPNFTYPYNLSGFPILVNNSRYALEYFENREVKVLKYDKYWSVSNIEDHSNEKFIYDNHILLPISENLNMKEIQKVAEITNDYLTKDKSV